MRVVREARRARASRSKDAPRRDDATIRPRTRKLRKEGLSAALAAYRRLAAVGGGEAAGGIRASKVAPSRRVPGYAEADTDSKILLLTCSLPAVLAT
jgi:hypothetical protein